MFFQVAQSNSNKPDPLPSEKNTHDHAPLNPLPEIQSLPPEEPSKTPNGQAPPLIENTPPQDAPILSIDTLTLPPEADPSMLCDSLTKNVGEKPFTYQMYTLVELQKITKCFRKECAVKPRKILFLLHYSSVVVVLDPKHRIIPDVCKGP